MGARDMAEVEITPGGDPVVEPPTPADEHGAPDRTAVRRSAVLRVLRRWWPVAAVAVAGVVGWNLVADAQERATAERHRETPGVLGTTVTPRLTAAPWADDGWQERILEQGTRLTSGGVVGPDLDESGVVVGVVLLDLSSGDALWRTPLPAPDTTADLASVSGSSGTQCSSDTSTPGTFWCVTDYAPTVAPFDSGTTTDLVRLDAATGEQLSHRTLPTGVAGTAVGDTLVTSGTGAGDLDLVATDAATGEARWSRTVPEATAADGAASARVHPLGPFLLVADGTWEWALDPVDGEVVGDGQALLLGRDGRLLATNGSSSTRILPGDGGGGTEVEGTPVSVAPDDGSAPDVEVLFRPDGTMRGVLRAVDARTGDALWEQPGPAESFAPVVLLDGVLYGDDGTELWAVDVVTGEEVWRTTSRRATSTLLTDGVSLLHTERDAGGATVLAAYALRDGSRSWAVPLPDGIRELSTWSWLAGGTLLGRTEDGVLVTLG